MSIDITVSGLNTEIDITLATQPETIIADIGEFTIIDREAYTGAYEVTPKAWEEQVLQTDGKLMTDDVTVFRVPYYETSNLFDGKTAYIAEEV